MNTSTGHFGEAESLLIGIGSPHAEDEGVRRALAGAQVHATLALCVSLGHVRTLLEEIRDEIAALRGRS